MHPAGCAGGGVLFEKRRAGVGGGAHAVNPPFPGCGAARCMRHQEFGDARVILDDIAFGRPGLGIQHLIEIGDLDPMSVDADGAGLGATHLSPTRQASPHSTSPHSTSTALGAFYGQSFASGEATPDAVWLP